MDACCLIGNHNRAPDGGDEALEDQEIREPVRALVKEGSSTPLQLQRCTRADSPWANASTSCRVAWVTSP
jgi:hypothetical protein